MIRVIMNGLGRVGQTAARLVLERPYLECVGAVVRVHGVGEDLGRVVGLKRDVGVKVTSSLADLVAQTRADVVLDATQMVVNDIKEPLFASIRAGINFVSVCQDLVYLWAQKPGLAHEIDELAKSHSVTVLGTGINPGFIQDLVPLVFTGPCQKVESITETRTVDVSGLGANSQEPLGIGVSVEEFERRLANGTLSGFPGHYEEIIEISDALGWKLAEVKQTLTPQVSKIRRHGTAFTIEPGRVCAVRIEATGIKENGRKAVSLILNLVFQPTAEAIKEDAELGLKTGDYLSIEGEPNIDVEIKGLKDSATITAYHAVNAIPYVVSARPGLLSPKDFPPFVPKE